MDHHPLMFETSMIYGRCQNYRTEIGEYESTP